MNCGKTKQRCVCLLAEDHFGPHVCECEGSWDDEGVIHAWPGLVQDGPSKGERIPLETLGLPSLPYYGDPA